MRNIHPNKGQEFNKQQRDSHVIELIIIKRVMSVPIRSPAFQKKKKKNINI
jgi:hypothetical protein